MNALTLGLAISLLASPIGVVGIGGKPGENRAAPRGVLPAPITALAVSPDGKTALSGSAKGELRRYTLTDALPHEPVGPLPGAVAAVVFGADGVAYAADDAGNLVRIPPGGASVALGVHPGGVRSLAVVSQTLASGGTDGEVRLWRDGALLTRFAAHEGAVTGLVARADRLWSVGWDRTLRRWKLTLPDPGKTRPKTAKLEVKVEAGPRELCGVAACGERLLTSCWDGSLRLWTTKRKRPAPTELPTRDNQEWASQVAFSPDGTTAVAVATAEGGLVLVDVAAGTARLRKRLPIPAAVAFVDAKRLLLGNVDGSVAIVALDGGAK